MTRRPILESIVACAIAVGPTTALAQEAYVPVLAPITGFLSLEGTSQRNGAVLALENPPPGVTPRYEVSDTATSPETAVNAFVRALDRGRPVAVSAPILGTQMLALMPLADEEAVPLVTVSGTARITEAGNPWIFRFFPGDAVVKAAQARYVVETLGARRPAVLYQTTAYGQSGRFHLEEQLTALDAPPVFAEGLDTEIRDMLPALTRALAAEPDVMVLHLHAGPTALVIRQMRESGIDLPIVAGSAMHQPATAALLEPAVLEGVCAESGSSPISGGSPAMEHFVAAYRAAFDSEPDAFAAGQYDAVGMVLAAVAAGATDAASVREALASTAYEGVAMTYRSDGSGNMAHDAVIICYDGESRVPRIAARYGGAPGG